MKISFPLGLVLSSLTAVTTAQAQITIDHAKALAGNVTSGDTPGYPVTLSKTGSYVLTGNLELGPADSPIAVRVTADDVTLDLNGFSIMRLGAACQKLPGGVVSCNTSGGVSTSAAHDHSGVVIEGANAVVRNGVVRGFVGHGIYAGKPGVWIDGVRVAHNGHDGIRIDVSGLGPNRVTRVSAMLNGGHGLAGNRVLIDGTSSYSNGGRGYLLHASNLGQSVAAYNIQGGVYAPNGGTLVRGSQFLGNLGPEVQGPLRSGGNNLYDDVLF